MKKTARFFITIAFIMCAFSLGAENVTLESDALKLVLHEQNGSFSLYRKTGTKGRLVALNDTSDNSSSTFFAIKNGDKFMALRRSYNIDISSVQNEDGSVSLIWESDLAFNAEARFSLVATDETMPADTVRVDFSIMNLSENDTSFAAKAVIDTVLGEVSRIHYTTAKGTAIRSEKSFTSMIQDKWVSSSNGTVSVSCVLAGSAATAPEYVLVANRDLLVSDVWKPAFNEKRGLSSVLSPNNSALGIWYAGKKLELFESASFTFFLTTAADGQIPPNAALIGLEAEMTSAGLDESTLQSASQIVDEAVSSSYEVIVPEITGKKIDYAYIQQLLDYVKVLEESDNPDPDEISKLSAEIDAVILELTE